MNWEDYKELHKKLEVTPDYLGNKKDDQLLHAAMGLCGESAEVSELVKKYMFGKRKRIDYSLVKDELSDVFWYLALGLRALDIDLEELMAYNAAKLTARYPELLEEPKPMELKPVEVWQSPSGKSFVFKLRDVPNDHL